LSKTLNFRKLIEVNTEKVVSNAIETEYPPKGKRNCYQLSFKNNSFTLRPFGPEILYTNAISTRRKALRGR